MDHRISIIDYAERGSSLYIQLDIWDAQTGKRHQEEVRFLAELLYGELVHAEKSPLSESCRMVVIEYLKNHFNR
ncbi:hypothetical protein QWY16_01480 [Planococcus shenhongbingii]|uniref:Uncharacterized protein n=1 Tax=Planococcus shenhongbingii TaxID=3058398 RepID=A0ABT8NG71_9BACL|nr:MULTISPECIES: hypothetical protein [unclassified Planococcus (in: firmicutes)]MDN7246788.1 hypothetical protein [Planococcus sp. N017]WKA58853.1 hypothetical protein QWY16_01480 [Planococcus sp. N016]